MSVPRWTVELHSHTIYSKDCLIRLEELPNICRARGIDKLAITDHNTTRGALQAARMFPMLVIPGEEIMTTGGELLAWYVKEEVPPRLSPYETIRLLREQGALIGVAHPFDRYRKGAWDPDELREIIDLVDTVEVFNARSLRAEDDARALAFARDHGKLETCGSDAHIAPEYGRATMQMEPFAPTVEGFRQALATAARTEVRSGPLVHVSSTYAKWAKRLFPSLRPR